MKRKMMRSSDKYFQFGFIIFIFLSCIHFGNLAPASYINQQHSFIAVDGNNSQEVNISTIEVSSTIPLSSTEIVVDKQYKESQNQNERNSSFEQILSMVTTSSTTPIIMVAETSILSTRTTTPLGTTTTTKMRIPTIEMYELQDMKNSPSILNNNEDHQINSSRNSSDKNSTNNSTSPSIILSITNESDMKSTVEQEHLSTSSPVNDFITTTTIPSYENRVTKRNELDLELKSLYSGEGESKRKDEFLSPRVSVQQEGITLSSKMPLVITDRYDDNDGKSGDVVDNISSSVVKILDKLSPSLLKVTPPHRYTKYARIKDIFPGKSDKKSITNNTSASDIDDITNDTFTTVTPSFSQFSNEESKLNFDTTTTTTPTSIKGTNLPSTTMPAEITVSPVTTASVATTIIPKKSFLMPILKEKEYPGSDIRGNEDISTMMTITGNDLTKTNDDMSTKSFSAITEPITIEKLKTESTTNSPTSPIGIRTEEATITPIIATLQHDVTTNEKFIELSDVENIDLKSMKKSQSQIDSDSKSINAEGDPPISSDGDWGANGEKVGGSGSGGGNSGGGGGGGGDGVGDDSSDSKAMSYGNTKKKSGGIVMGHDGVKVTKKKQLISEKNFKDDEILMNNLNNFVERKRSENIQNVTETQTTTTMTTMTITSSMRKKNEFDSISRKNPIKMISGHLGPLVFKEKTFNEHETENNMIFSKTLFENENVLVPSTEATKDSSNIEKFDKFIEGKIKSFTSVNSDTFTIQNEENKEVRFPTTEAFSSTKILKTSLYNQEKFNKMKSINLPPSTTTIFEFDPFSESLKLSTEKSVQKMEDYELTTESPLSTTNPKVNNNLSKLSTSSLTLERESKNNFFENNLIQNKIEKITLAPEIYLKEKYNTGLGENYSNQDNAVTQIPGGINKILKIEQELLLEVNPTITINVSNNNHNENLSITTESYSDMKLFNTNQISTDHNMKATTIETENQYNNEKTIVEIDSLPNTHLSTSTPPNRDDDSIQLGRSTFFSNTKFYDIPQGSTLGPKLFLENSNLILGTTEFSTHNENIFKNTLQSPKSQPFTENVQFTIIQHKMNKTEQLRNSTNIDSIRLENSKFKETETIPSQQIEIEINVSEGSGNSSRDLMQFSFRKDPESNEFPKKIFNSTNIFTFERMKLSSSNLEGVNPKSNEMNAMNENEFVNDTDILVVEITDSENSTTNGYVSNERQQDNISNENFKFTIHGEQPQEFEPVKYKSFSGYENSNLKQSTDESGGDGVVVGNDNSKSSNNNNQRESNNEDDDLFVPDLKLEPYEDLVVPQNGITSNSNVRYDKDLIDRDSDTIFYISNTEVKVVESIPTPNTNPGNIDLRSSSSSSSFSLSPSAENFSAHSSDHQEQHQNPSKLESQFFPVVYEEDVIIDFPRKNSTNSSAGNKGVRDHYEEDIILSPLKNNFDPLKIIRNPNGGGEMHQSNAANSDEDQVSRPNIPASIVDVSYVGESFIDVHESPRSTSIPSSFDLMNRKNDGDVNGDDDDDVTNNDKIQTGSSGSPSNSGGGGVNENQLSDVIIQPAIIPEMSIGVPIIGALPPQIELKEIDFMPDEVNNNNNNNGGDGFDDSDSNNNSNDEDSIQYGGDLISNVPGGIGSTGRERGGGGFNIETGYSLGDDRISGSVGSVSGRDTIGFGGGGSNSGGNVIGDNDVTVTSQIVMHAVDNLQKNELVAELPADNASGYVKDVSSSKHSGNSSTPDIAASNATAYSVLDENDGDFNITDVQTLFLACFATLIPLILSVLLAFGLRYLWRKYRSDPSSGSGLIGDNSTDPLAAKSMTLSQDELKSTESGYTINRSNDTLESSTEILTKYDGTIGGTTNPIGGGVGGIGDLGGGVGIVCDGVGNNITVNGTATTNKVNHSGANGSVITMTLKNNHLIVETEERNDISRDARETKMHYTSSEKDGVFVVEVARGADSTGIPDSPHKDSDTRQNSCILDIDALDKTKTNDIKGRNHEEVQIHQPPSSSSDAVSDNNNDILIEVDETNISEKSETCINLGNSNTGLSQSDLSTSSGDSNRGYIYGNQQLYTVDSDENRSNSPKIKVGATSSSSPIESVNTYENGDCPPPQSSSSSSSSSSTTKTAAAAAAAGATTTKILPQQPASPGENSHHGNDTKLDSSKQETKPIITAALLKQDTVIEISDRNVKFLNSISPTVTVVPETKTSPSVIENKITENGTGAPKDHEIANEKLHQEQQHKLGNGEISPPLDNGQVNSNQTTENGFDSIISLPAPPSTEEIKQMNDIIQMENSQLDSLPPPPPPELNQNQTTVTTLHEVNNITGLTGEGQQNGVAVVAVSGSS